MRLDSNNTAVIDCAAVPTLEQLIDELRRIRETTPPIGQSNSRDVLIDLRNGEPISRGNIAYLAHIHSRLPEIISFLTSSQDQGEKK